VTVAACGNVSANDTAVPSRGIVLIAEDADETRMMLALWLAEVGYEVGCATNAKDMIELLRTSPTPIAIFVDLLMPDGVGNGVLEFLAHDPRLAAVPTAIITGWPQVAPPGYRVFTKPVSLEALVKFINEPR
jgi:DNA-binding NtrC family response regulator